VLDCPPATPACARRGCDIQHTNEVPEISQTRLAISCPHAPPDIVCFPRTTAEVSEILKISAMHRVGDVVDKWDDVGIELHFAVRPLHQLHIRLPGLVHDVQIQIYNTFSIDFESPDDT